MSKGIKNGTNRKQIKKSGFRARMSTYSGRKVISLRRRKKRKKIVL
uniref:Large ribosomal subunit protein bL34c n=1 Tax=Gracilariopsis longissima TaxID=172976 RepID=A0A345U9C7_9FLOR|nr:ribosomal protein L34 [Gracilariopsis longissima]YP_010199325.1 ribosomal protein L34 [Gracilariopsis tenuifrons]AXI97063.1 ribosomal protein L34 [Gracilariopsis longissima]UAD88979.1 ribosomal protein L34 [Gracilariopsis longissima]UAD89183.1 ribosomal protein L34 [Gracilariopsis tenuifrons]